jgi:hypothetical protein
MTAMLNRNATSDRRAEGDVNDDRVPFEATRSQNFAGLLSMLNALETEFRVLLNPALHQV